MRITGGSGAHETPRASSAPKAAKASGAVGGVKVSKAEPAPRAKAAPPAVAAVRARARAAGSKAAGFFRSLVSEGGKAKRASGSKAEKAPKEAPACPVHRPLVAVHRGMTAWMGNDDLKQHLDVGNSMKAFQASIDAGADVLELDVRRTKDGTLVVYHEAELFHDPGHMKKGKGRKISDVDYKDLPKLSHGGGKIPTLDEVIDLAKKHDVALQVEVKDKPSSRSGFLWHHSGKDTARDIAKKLKHRMADDKFTISSFHRGSIRAIEDEYPSLKTVLWVNKTVLDNNVKKGSRRADGSANPAWILKRAKDAGADGVAVGLKSAKDGEMRRLATEKKIDVWVGDIHDDNIADAANDGFIEGIVTEQPEEVLKAQGRKPKKHGKGE